MKKIVCKVGVLTKTIRLLPFITIYANPIKAGWKDFAIDIGWLCFAIGMRFNKPSKLKSNEENTTNMYTSHFNGWVYYTESLTYDFQKRVQRKSLHETIPASGFNI